MDASLGAPVAYVAKDGERPLTLSRDGELLVDNGEFYRTSKLQYRGGQRYPHLVRAAGAPDLLSEILASHAPPVK